MENNTELLKEYASLAGREDAKSEARKAEILSYIKTHANDADREEAKAFIGQKMEQIKDNVEVLRKQIETEDYKLLPLATSQKSTSARVPHGSRSVSTALKCVDTSIRSALSKKTSSTRLSRR